MANEQINFEWDPNKAASNLRKHGVSFDRAASVFQDPEALSLYDGKHSEHEDRWVTLGLDRQGYLLVISHTWREGKEGQVRCRIISARKPTNNEAREYRA